MSKLKKKALTINIVLGLIFNLHVFTWIAVANAAEYTLTANEAGCVTNSDCQALTPTPTITITSNASQIVSFISGKCASVWAGSSTNLARVVQWECRGAPSQLFTLRESNEIDKYFVVAKHSGKCLAVNGGKKWNGAKIVQWPCSNGSYGNDVWKLESVNGGYRLRAKHSGRCLSVLEGGTVNGTELVQSDCTNSNNMTFEIDAITTADSDSDSDSAPSNIGQIVSFTSGKCVSVWGGSSANLARFVQWECSGAPSQLFTLRESNEIDNYFVVAKHSGKCLGVNGGAKWNGAKIVQLPCSDGSTGNDIWRLEAVNEGYRLRAKHSGRCLSVFGGRAADGTGLVQWDCANSHNMTFEVGAITTGLGKWSSVKTLPLIPAAVSVLNNGNVLLWSSYSKMTFGGDAGYTQTAILNPQTGAIIEEVVTRTRHDMFCPGISTLVDGRVMVTGGSSAAKTSIYDPVFGTWEAGAQLNNPRAYHTSAVLSDGSVIVAGGSWAGGTFDKGVEIYRNGQWRLLNNVPTLPMVGSDPLGLFRGDNHFWLFPWTNDRVFQAGPSKEMHWISTIGEGAIASAGYRASDQFSLNGNAVMYEPGKILTVGGSTAYNYGNSSANAHIIDINGASVTTTAINSMARPRTFHNSVVLPTGEVAIFGGVSEYPVTFVDAAPVMTPELFNPETKIFTPLAHIQVPRTYHSFAVLLPDARVLVGGGGLCGGCVTNHANYEIFTPPYLLDDGGNPAVRPSIEVAPRTANYIQSYTVETDQDVDEFVLVRMASATHSTNTDQRRIPVDSENINGSYIVSMPSEPGIALPGEYYLFALKNGVPSVAHIIKLD